MAKHPPTPNEPTDENEPQAPEPLPNGKKFGWKVVNSTWDKFSDNWRMVLTVGLGTYLTLVLMYQVIIPMAKNMIANADAAAKAQIANADAAAKAQADEQHKTAENERKNNDRVAVATEEGSKAQHAAAIALTELSGLTRAINSTQRLVKESQDQACTAAKEAKQSALDGLIEARKTNALLAASVIVHEKQLVAIGQVGTKVEAAHKASDASRESFWGPAGKKLDAQQKTLDEIRDDNRKRTAIQERLEAFLGKPPPAPAKGPEQPRK